LAGDFAGCTKTIVVFRGGLKRWITIGCSENCSRRSSSNCKRLGSLEAEIEARIAELPVEQLEELAEALLDFTAPSDLTGWLDAQASK